MCPKKKKKIPAPCIKAGLCSILNITGSRKILFPPFVFSVEEIYCILTYVLLKGSNHEQITTDTAP